MKPRRVPAIIAAWVFSSLAAAQGVTSVDITPQRSDGLPASIYGVIAHPMDGQKLLALGSGAMWVSRDGGGSWHVPAGHPDPASIQRYYAHPGRPGVVFLQEGALTVVSAGVARRSGGRVFRSGDLGETWEQIGPAYERDGQLTVSPVGADPENPERIVGTRRTALFCLAGCGFASAGSDVELVESLDSGRTWSTLGARLPSRFANVDGTLLQGPTPATPETYYYSVPGVGVAVSIDGARTWSFPLGLAPHGYYTWLRQDPRNAAVIYARSGPAFREGNSERSIISKSVDHGVTWRVIRDVTDATTVGLLLDRVVPNRLWTYDTTGLYLSDDGGESWRHLGFAADVTAEWRGPDPNTGVRFLETNARDPSVAYIIVKGRLLRVSVPSREPIAVEYRHGDRYWVALDEAEAASQDYRAHEAIRTGRRFGLWSATAAPAGALGICRFQGNPAGGQTSRFVSLADFECNGLKRNPAFNLEGENEYFAVAPDASGICMGNLLPVRRFNNLQPNVNHRYVADPMIAQQMRDRGWYDEGVRMCARPLAPEEQQ